jgi:crossover junction endodeoxyribonuclease RuvC
MGRQEQVAASGAIGHAAVTRSSSQVGSYDGWFTLRKMRVFGIDCGTEITGYGVVESDEQSRTSRLICQTFGAVYLSKQKTMPQRLKQVFDELSTAIQLWQPDVVAVEEVFYSVNAKSALKLGQVRGVALLAAATLALPLAEYAPLKIKSSVVGYGLAGKEQVQFMVARLLNLAEPPTPPDAADALAIAICHIHTAQTLNLQGARG